MTETLFPADREIIKRFASGDKSLREHAISAYRRARRHGVYPESEPAMGFMHEIDNTVPDLAMRAILRKKLMAS